MAKRIENLYEGLTEQQRIFVDTYVELGGGRGAPAAAARKAGYSEASIHSLASQLLRNERVLSAIKRLTDRKFRAGAVMALSALIHIAENGTTEAARLKAAEGILDRTGFGPRSTQDMNVNLTDTRSQKEVIDAIAEKINQLKDLEPRIKELEYKPEVPVIDAEFSEVDLDKEINSL